MLTLAHPAREHSAEALRDADSSVYGALFDEVIQAVEKGDPNALIGTPGFRTEPNTTLEALVSDDTARKGDTLMAYFIKLWSRELASVDAARRLQAQAELAELAQRHAAFHEERAA